MGIGLEKREIAEPSNGDGSETVIFRDTVPRSRAGQRFIRLLVTPSS